MTSLRRDKYSNISIEQCRTIFLILASFFLNLKLKLYIRNNLLFQVEENGLANIVRGAK